MIKNNSIYFIPEIKKKLEASNYFELSYNNKESIIQLLESEFNTKNIDIIRCEATHLTKNHNKIYNKKVPLIAKGWLRLLDVCFGVDAIAVIDDKYYPLDFKHTKETTIRDSRIYGKKDDLEQIKEFLNKFISNFSDSSLKELKSTLKITYGLFKLMYDINIIESSNSTYLDIEKIENDLYFKMLKKLENKIIKINTKNLNIDTDKTDYKYTVKVYDNDFKDDYGSVSIMIKKQ